jgi:hypothetical protein
VPRGLNSLRVKIPPVIVSVQKPVVTGCPSQGESEELEAVFSLKQMRMQRNLTLAKSANSEDSCPIHVSELAKVSSG